MSGKNHAFFYATRGENVANTGFFQRAIALLNQAIKICEDCKEEEWSDQKLAEVLLYRAYCYQGLNDYQKDMADLERSLELNPNSEWGWRMLGICQINLSLFKKAVDSFTAAIEFDPKGAYLKWNHAYRGQALRELGQDKPAKADFKKALELDPNFGYVIQQQKLIGSFTLNTSLPINIKGRLLGAKDKAFENIFKSPAIAKRMKNEKIDPSENYEARIPGDYEISLKVFGFGVDKKSWFCPISIKQSGQPEIRIRTFSIK